jgi:peptidoglycan-N-acetylglucosamine deacetylase
MDEATAEIKEMLGVTPRSFAYPCGQTYVGRRGAGELCPLVAKRFLSGRGYLNESANDPGICDLAYLMGTGYDQMPFTEVKRLMDTAARDGRWLILVGHDIGPRKFQSVEAEFCWRPAGTPTIPRTGFGWRRPARWPRTSKRRAGEPA